MITNTLMKWLPVVVLAASPGWAAEKSPYPDGRPAARMRLAAKDQGVVLKHGNGPGQCDLLGAREALVFEDEGVYHLFYDGAGPKGWLVCLATSKDLTTWEKKGTVLDFGKPGEPDAAAASSPWVYHDRSEWHMFYLGTPNASPPPDRIPCFPYLTLKAHGKSLAGPWSKQPEVIPFRTKPDTYYSITASPGHVVPNGGGYLQFFSATTNKPGNPCVQRTLGIARTMDLDGAWTIDPKPIVPVEEQVENSSLYFEKSIKTWFLFTNHIGLDGGEYTDAVWVYWSKDLNHWDANHKAVVLDGRNCTWSRKCVGMPSVMPVGKRLAIMYDAPGGDSTSHMNRDIGLAWLDLPLAVPQAAGQDERTGGAADEIRVEPVPASGVDPRKSARWDVFEVSYSISKEYSNPFTDVELNVVFRQGDKQWIIPAFWAGGKTWKARFAPPLLGTYEYRAEGTDKAHAKLGGTPQVLEVTNYQGDNPLLKHGFVGVADDHRHFEHADGTPFFWLGDTWWKCLCKRMPWEGFQELTADRKAKGFSVVQIVCGPYPDEGFLEPRWGNEGGMPYQDRAFTTINPLYFEFADRRLAHLVAAGISPAIVGAWGRGDCNSMEAIGAVGLKRHWRYLVARYGAYPVFWILAGEIPDETKWAQGPWADVAKYLRGIDPYHHPLTCHTGKGRRGENGDDVMIDFDMVGGNHDAPSAMSRATLEILTTACAKTPPMPVLVGETCYEGHMQQGFQDVQRHLFWMYMLSGAAGHTYGAAGVWHAGVEGDPGVSGAFGGQVYDWTTWREGMNYPGSTQLGIGKKLLENYPWWRFEPHADWAPGCYAAGIPGEVRIIYLPRRNIYNWSGPEVRNLEPDVDWHAYYFDPATGRKFDQGIVKASARAGDKNANPVGFHKNVPSPQDWVLVLERVKPQ